MTETPTVPGPIIVAGMHRSRTSAFALCLGHLGLDLGSRLLPADRWSPAGYGEDQGVIDLHRRALGVEDEYATDGTSWPDWGWPPAVLEPRLLADDLDKYLCARVGNLAQDALAWGWKDPRTTLFLRQWARSCPSARFVLLYRSPIGVEVSLERLRFPLAVQARAQDIWAMYNARVVRFAKAERDRSIVISTDAFLRSPTRVLQYVVDRLGMACDASDVQQAVDNVLLDRLVRRSQLEDLNGEVTAAGEVTRIWNALEALDEAWPVIGHRPGW